LERGVGSPEQHLVVLNGIPDVDPALHAKPVSNPPHIVMIARFEPQKDPETLVAALAGLTDRAWTAELVGDGEGLEGCRRRAAALGLGDRVTFPGPVDRPDEVLARAQIFVLTTNWEGLPVTILEAMRAGLPTVASDVGGVAEAVDHGGTGFLVPRSDVGAVRDNLAKLIDDPELRVRLGTQARKRYESDFTEQRMLAGVAEVYRQVVADYPARRS
jgi:glycosyltransferase involved in cell wall biosynthesis